MAGKAKVASKADAKEKDVQQGSEVQKETGEMALGREQEAAGEMNQGAMAQAVNQSGLEQKSQGNGTATGGMTYKVKFTSFPENSSIKGICSVTMNDAFCVKGVKVIEGSKGLFMALPSYKSGEEYKDVCHPVTAEGRKSMSEAVLNAYAVQSEEHAQNIGAAGMGQGEQMAAPEGVPMEQVAGMNQGGIGQQ